MCYKDEWQEIESLADQELAVNPQPSVNPEPGTYNAADAQAMFAWLKYAATIGDESYLNICWRLQPFHNIERPEPFHPLMDE